MFSSITGKMGLELEAHKNEQKKSKTAMAIF